MIFARQGWGHDKDGVTTLYNIYVEDLDLL